jgi:hypothetical protein
MKENLTDLQIGYMYTLISVAKIKKSLAQSFALRNDITEMKTYLLSNAPAQCRCTNNSDLCGRCDTLELLHRF